MKKILIFSALFLLASVSLSAQVVKGAGLWYFNGWPNVTPSTATGTEVAYSINNKTLAVWNRTTLTWDALVKDSSITNELQDLILSNDTLSLTLSDSVVLMAQYRNHVWEITNLSDTTSITGDIEGDIAYTSTGDTIAFRGATAWLPFTGGGGGGTFNSFNIAGDTGSDIITDGQTVTVAGGYGINTAETGGTVTVTADTSQLATQSDISGLPSGTGTNQRIVVWTGTNSQGNSTQLQSAAGVALDANLAYRITGGTTASRPTGAAGMMYYNTSNNWFDYHNGTAWFNPARSATTNGIFTPGSLLFAHSDGTIQQNNSNLFFDNSSIELGIGTNAPGHMLDVLATGAVNASIAARFRAAVGGGLLLGAWTSTYGGIWSGNAGTPTTANAAMYSNGTNTYLNGTTGANWAINGSTKVLLTSTVFRTQDVSVGISTSLPDRLLHVESATSATNTVVPVSRFSHISTGTPTAGAGVRLELEAKAATTNRLPGTMDAVYTTVTNAAEVSDFVISTLRAGTLTESLRSLGNGTLQIGTLSGTATQLMGATSGNIATAVTLGAGLSFSSGTLNGAFLPLTLTGATEVNTAGQSLYFRDAGAYPFQFMNSNYWLAASGINNYIDVGSTASNVKVISDGLIELNSSVNTSIITTGRFLIDGDSTVVSGTLPVNTNATHVLVRDAVTERLEEKAVASFAPTAPAEEIVFGTGTGTDTDTGLKYRDDIGNRLLSTNGKIDFNTIGEQQTSTASKFNDDFFMDIDPDFEPTNDSTVLALIRLRNRGASGTGTRRPFIISEDISGGANVIQLFETGLKMFRTQNSLANNRWGYMQTPNSSLDIGFRSAISFAAFYRSVDNADTTKWFDFKSTGELFAHAYRTGGESESTSFTGLATVDDLGNYHRANTATVKDSIFGTAITTATLDFGSTAAGTVSDLTVTVTGAAVGDIVTIGVPHGSVPAAGTFFAWVSATNTVTVRFANNALVTAYDPASGSFKVRVEK